jgi:hypothetical protein
MYCEIKKQENPHLKGVTCCLKCHSVHKQAVDKGAEFDPTWQCCEMHHYETIYRPSSRKINDLRS